MKSITRFLMENPSIIAIAFVMHAGALFIGAIWPMYFDRRMVCLYPGLWAVALIPWIVRRFSIGKLVVCALLVASVFIHIDVHDPRAPFLSDFRHIKPGMTVAQADGIMKAHRRWSSAELGTLYYSYRHLDERYEAGRGADAGIVEVRNGRVVSVRFAPD